MLRCQEWAGGIEEVTLAPSNPMKGGQKWKVVLLLSETYHPVFDVKNILKFLLCVRVLPAAFPLRVYGPKLAQHFEELAQQVL